VYSGIIVSLGLGPHQIEHICGELVESLVDGALGDRRVRLEILVQLCGEPPNRTTCELIQVIDKPTRMLLLESAVMNAAS
jgi:hypothetical protein